MKHKVCEIEGALLDAAVAMALGHRGLVFNARFGEWRSLTTDGELSPFVSFSTDWAAGGPIIQRERGGLVPEMDGHGRVSWFARIGIGETRSWAFGPTPLIAVMRAYVHSRFGDEVELPEAGE